MPNLGHYQQPDNTANLFRISVSALVDRSNRRYRGIVSTIDSVHVRGWTKISISR